MWFNIYADFESLLKRVRGSDKKNNTWYTEKYQKHIPCSFAYKVVCVHDKFSKPVVNNRGKWNQQIYWSNPWRVWLLQKSDKKAF